jgi:hypothetical protein
VAGTTFTLAGNGNAPAVGDGVSTTGACASGAASGCAVLANTYVNGVAQPANGNGLTKTTTTLTFTGANGAFAAGTGSKGVSTGKWYWEASTPNNGQTHYGAGFYATSANFGYWPDFYAFSAYPGYGSPGVYGGSANDTRAIGTRGSALTLGFALDAGASTIAVYANGSRLSTYSISGKSKPYYPAVFLGVNAAGGSGSFTLNFGATNFSYPVPSGYYKGIW